MSHLHLQKYPCLKRLQLNSSRRLESKALHRILTLEMLMRDCEEEGVWQVIFITYPFMSTGLTYFFVSLHLTWPTLIPPCEYDPVKAWLHE